MKASLIVFPAAMSGLFNSKACAPPPAERGYGMRTASVRGPRTCPADHVTFSGAVSSKSG